MSDINLDVTMDYNTLELDVTVKDNAEELDVKFQEVVNIGGTNDYEKLKNLPSLNGSKIIGNVDEIDPTVPGYVKEGKAVNEDNVGTIGILDVKRIWDSVFNK